MGAYVRPAGRPRSARRAQVTWSPRPRPGCSTWFRSTARTPWHPVILAAIARHTVDGALEGTRDGYRVVRTELGEAAPPHAVDIALAAYRTEGFRLADVGRAVRLVEQALREQQARPQP
jgi:hypothetical protein